MLGTDDRGADGKILYGVFAKSVLEHVELPSTLKRIENGAFHCCENLTDIELPEGLQYIGRLCFFGDALERVVIPSSVKVLEENAFCLCKKLEYVWLQEGLERIGRECFAGTII